MEKNLKVYEGDKPFIFISYAHEDKEEVAPVIRGLQQRGYRVWYDHGIHGGKNWIDALGEKVDLCSVFILFISQYYMTSPMCKTELSLAKEQNKTIIPIYLEKVQLDAGMRLALAGIQALMPDWKRNERALWQFIEMSENLASCKDGRAVVLSSDDGDNVPLSSRRILGMQTSQMGERLFRILEKGYSLLKKLIDLVMWMPAVLVVLLLIITLAGKFSPSDDTSTGQSQPPATENQVQTTAPAENRAETTVPEETQAAVSTETTAPVSTAPTTLSGNVLMEVPSPAENENLQNTPAFGTSITRAQVGSIWFMDIEGYNLANADEAVDISQNQDGSVLAWTVKDGDLYQLHIAGKGGVDAPVNSANLFRDMVNLTQIYFDDAFFTANAESMKAMFYNCENLIRVDVSGFNTAKVKNFGWMFADCRSLDKLDVSNFDTSSATKMTYMFANCKDLWELDLHNFCTENVNDMRGVFRGCEKLIALNIESFDTAKVKNMSQMFYQCGDLVELDLSHFDTANVTDMSHMFHGCEKLLELDVSSFDTALVTDMSSMFSGCSKLSVLDVSGFDTRNVTDMSYMFSNCRNLEHLELSSFKTYNVTDMSYMFYNNARLTNLDFSGFNTNKVTKFENFMLENQKVNGFPWQGLFADASQ